MTLHSGSTPEEIENRNKRIEFLRQQRRSDLGWLLTTVQGRRVIFALLQSAGLNGSSFDRDASVMAYREGRRSVALELALELEQIDRKAFETMFSEVTEGRMNALRA